MGTLQGFIGTYASEKSLGLYRFSVDTDSGTVTKPQLYFQADDAKCMDFFHGYLAAPVESQGAAGMVLVKREEDRGILAHQVMEEANAACFLTHDEEYLYTANYHQGHVLLYREEQGRLIREYKLQAAPKAGCHQVILRGQRILVPCLKLDKILVFDRTGRRQQTGEITFPRGSGPRHGIFSKDGEDFYVVGEKSCSLFCFRVSVEEKEPRFQLMEEIPLYENKGDGYAAAAIRLSPDGRFLYISVRGADELVVFGLADGRRSIIQHSSSGGKHPRDFLLTPDGRFLLVVNRSSSQLVSFPRDGETGLLGRPVSRETVYEGVGILLDA